MKGHEQGPDSPSVVPTELALRKLGVRTEEMTTAEIRNTAGYLVEVLKIVCKIPSGSEVAQSTQ